MRVLVIGGTQFHGRAFTEQTLAAGHDVTLFHRGRGDDPFPEATHVHGDRNATVGPLEGLTFDAVLDTCGYVPREVAASTAWATQAGVRSYAFVSSISAQREDLPPGSTEDEGVHEPPFPDTEEVTEDSYGPLKVACERVVREAFGDAALVVRPGYIVGPHDPTDRFTYWLRRATAGGEMLAPGPPEEAMQWIDARDLAAFELSLLERGVGGTFSVVTPPGRDTTAGVIEAARAHAQASTRPVWVDAEFLQELGDERWTEIPMWHPEWPGMHRMSTERAEGAGLSCRPTAATVRDTIEWDRARGLPEPMAAGLTLERERELLDAWRASAA